jgi:hypothetical protein
VYGHAGFLRAAESKYQRDLAEYNAQWKPVAESNDRIAQTAERIAEIEKQTERLRNDTAYWSRKNKVQPSKSGIKVELSTTKVEIPPAPKAPADSSVEYLARWDAYVRLAGFGELGLSIVTLIFVRTRTAARNRTAASETIEDDGDFPEEIDIEKRSPLRRGELAKRPQNPATHVSPKIGDTDTDKKATQSNTEEGLKRLRETLSLIGFEHGPTHFKSDIKPGGYLWIRQMKSEHGEKRQIAQTKAALSILDDVLMMAPADFKLRLEDFLRKRDFKL